MKLCNSFEELKHELDKKIKKAMEKEVAETVRETMQTHIATDVYDAYNPKLYKRRYGNDGLIADSNIISRYDDISNTLTTTNITVGNNNFSPTDNYLSPIIESGEGYNFDFEYFNIPRPFVRNTYEELIEYGWAQKALEIGLKRQGLDIK